MKKTGALLLFVAVIGALAVATRWPHPAAWSVHAYAFLPTAVGVGVLLAVALLVLPQVAGAVGAGLLRGIGFVQQRFWATIAFAIACVGLFTWARVRFQFLGDGQLWVDHIRQGNTFHHFEPLASFLVPWVANLASRSDPGAAAGTLAIVLGGIYVVLSARLGRALSESPAAAALIWFLLLWNPIALLWFGYVESYPLVLTLQVGLMLALVQAARRRAPLWPVFVAMVLVNASHVLTLAWWPALFVVIGWRQKAEDRLQLRRVLVHGTVMCLAVGVLVGGLWAAMGVDVREVWERLGSRRGIEGVTASWFFSLAHLVDVLNEIVLLLAPALVLGVGGILGGAQVMRFPRSPAGSSTLVLVVGPTLTLLFVPPLLGGARDWDLYAFMALPWILWSVDLWSQVQLQTTSSPATAKRSGKKGKRDERPARPRAQPDLVLAGRSMGLAAALTVGWVVVPLDADRGARHFELLQDPRGTFARFARAHGNEALGIYYRDRDPRLEHAAWVRATAADSLNPRYHINRANAALKLEDIREAQHHFERALDRGIDEWHIYYNLGVCGMQLQDLTTAEHWFTQLIDKYPQEWRGWGGRGEARIRQQRYADALGDVERMVRLQPNDPYAHQLLGQVHQGMGNLDAARTAWRRSLELQPNNPEVRRLLQLP